MISKKQYLKLLDIYAWQFKPLDDLFANRYKRSNIIVEYYIEHFDNFLKLEFEEYDDEKSITGKIAFKRTDMLSWLKKKYYKKYLENPEKLLRNLEVDWANILLEDYSNSYIAAKEGLPKELQDEIQRLWMMRNNNL